MADYQPGHSDLLGGDTIAAIITPPGEGGIAAVRLAGTDSLAVFDRHFQPSYNQEFEPFMMRHGLFVDNDHAPIDEITAVYMPHGKSYTGLEQVEIFCHGGRLVVRRILEALLADGTRAAEPGEFTRLAFLSGRIDLARAEAVAEVIGANTETSLSTAREHLLGGYSGHIEELREKIVAVIGEVEASIDFPEEEIQPETIEQQATMIKEIRADIGRLLQTYKGGQLIKEGFKVAIGGRPNAGKSSLFNALLRHERALVTPTAGTTRDYLSEWIDIEGFAVNLVDTAGIRKGGGKIEQAGQESARKIMAGANLVFWLTDLSRRDWVTELKEDLTSLREFPLMIGGNKLDLVNKTLSPPDFVGETDWVSFSCRTMEGLDQLVEKLRLIIESHIPDLTSGFTVTSARHQQKLDEAEKLLKKALENVRAGESPEIVAFDLRQAAGAIEEITGRVYNEDILGHIFSKFCIGK